jgi:hypothetical protein
MKEIHLEDTRSQNITIYHAGVMGIKDLHLEDTRSLNILPLGNWGEGGPPFEDTRFLNN